VPKIKKRAGSSNQQNLELEGTKKKREKRPKNKREKGTKKKRQKKRKGNQGKKKTTSNIVNRNQVPGSRTKTALSMETSVSLLVLRIECAQST
jgi:hypothetical protein